MAKKEKEVEVIASLVMPGKPAEYFRLVRSNRNLFSVETVTVEDGKITATDASEATYLPIAFDKLRRKTGESFFAAVQEEHKG